MIDWRHWHNEPYLVGGLVLLGWLWAVLAGPLRVRLAPGEPFPRRQAWYFYSALVIFYLAVGSPLDQIGERFLFSAHMVQHQLLIYPAALLFLSGLPAWMVDVVMSRPELRRPLRILTHPLPCGIIYLLTISVWHAPLLYDWALQNKLIHVLEHVMFFGAALFYWWPVASPSRAFPPRRFATQMIYLFTVQVGMMPIYAYITFSGDVLNATYEYAPRLIPNFSATEDQLLAGVEMQLVAMAVSMTTFGLCFYRWLASGERAEKK